MDLTTVLDYLKQNAKVHNNQYMFPRDYKKYYNEIYFDDYVVGTIDDSVYNYLKNNVEGIKEITDEENQTYLIWVGETS